MHSRRSLEIRSRSFFERVEVVLTHSIAEAAAASLSATSMLKLNLYWSSFPHFFEGVALLSDVPLSTAPSPLAPDGCNVAPSRAIQPISIWRELSIVFYAHTCACYLGSVNFQGRLKELYANMMEGGGGSDSLMRYMGMVRRMINSRGENCCFELVSEVACVTNPTAYKLESENKIWNCSVQSIILQLCMHALIIRMHLF